MSAYVTSKHAVLGLVKTLSLELAEDMSQVSLDRIGLPKDVANVAVF